MTEWGDIIPGYRPALRVIGTACHECGGPADGQCVLCELAVCRKCARVKDGDRFCSPFCPGDG